MSARHSLQDLISQALDAMHTAGCPPHDPAEVVFDGMLHRFRVDGDKANTKNGWLIFYSDGIPAGAFGSWKSGIAETWCAKRDHELTSAEREQRDQHLADAKQQRAQDRRATQASAKLRAADLWDKSRETVDAKHPYLLKKQIPAIGIRQLQTQLVVPLRDLNGALHSLQFIGLDGTKIFLTGGAVEGNCCIFGEPDGADRLLICEGYATGVSLHLATKLPVIVAFNAGNLKPVAASARLKWPHAALILCADDDRETEGNPGQTKAKAAAEAVNGFVITPLFADLQGNPTDFNDLHCREGLPALQAQLTNALLACQPAHLQRENFERRIDDTADFETLTGELPRLILASHLPKATISHLLKRIAAKAKVPVADLKENLKQATTANGWKAKLRYEENGNLRDSRMNMVTVLNHDPTWRGVLFYDEFSGDILKRRLPPFANPVLGAWTDLDSSKTAMWLEEHYDIAPKTLAVDEAIQIIADLHSLHVVREYLDRLRWDGTPRCKTWALKYLGAADTPVHRFVGQAWLCGAVMRAYQPGAKFDNVLVLEGNQGSRKSTALATLGGAWHCESITDVGSKDSLTSLRGMWIVEFAELDAIGRVESSRIKQHISAQSDVYRPPYGRRSIRVQRQNVFAATCNPEKYLKDETGARRFWPVRCGKTIDIEALERDRDQLWAEAVHLWRNGEQTWADASMTYLTEAQDARFVEDPWEEHIAEMLAVKRECLMREVLDYLGVEVCRQTQSDKNRAAKILRRLGFTCHLERQGKSVQRVYKMDNPL